MSSHIFLLILCSCWCRVMLCVHIMMLLLVSPRVTIASHQEDIVQHSGLEIRGEYDESLSYIASLSP